MGLQKSETPRCRHPCASDPRFGHISTTQATWVFKTMKNYAADTLVPEIRNPVIQTQPKQHGCSKKSKSALQTPLWHKHEIRPCKHHPSNMGVQKAKTRAIDTPLYHKSKIRSHKHHPSNIHVKILFCDVLYRRSGNVRWCLGGAYMTESWVCGTRMYATELLRW